MVNHENNTTDVFPSGFVCSIHKADAAPRVQVLSLLAALDPDDPVQKAFMHSFICQLMIKYKEEAELANYRNYINSLTHRHKHRLFAALLLLQPAVDEVMSKAIYIYIYIYIYI